MKPEERDAAEARLRELEAKATSGPWSITAAFGPNGERSALRDLVSRGVDGTPDEGVCEGMFAEDADLAVALRNDALPIIDSYRAELAALREVALDVASQCKDREQEAEAADYRDLAEIFEGFASRLDDAARLRSKGTP